MWQHVKLSEISLGTRPRYSLVDAEDVKKPIKQAAKPLPFSGSYWSVSASAAGTGRPGESRNPRPTVEVSHRNAGSLRSHAYVSWDSAEFNWNYEWCLYFKIKKYLFNEFKEKAFYIWWVYGFATKGREREGGGGGRKGGEKEIEWFIVYCAIIVVFSVLCLTE